MMALRRFLTIGFALILFTGGNAVQAQQTDTPSEQSVRQQQLTPEEMQLQAEIIRAIRENMGLFGNIYRQISLRYVDPINPGTFMKAGIEGMLATLDPYTEYMEPDNADDLQIMSRGRYGGVGLQIGTRGAERTLTVISPIEGTPAWRLGIRAGDQILKIAGESTEGFNTSDAAQRLRGEPGSGVEVTIRRPGVADLLIYTIVREEIQVKDVSYAGFIEPGIGYVRLTRFSREAGDEVRAAINDLLSQGEMEGLIFDLRSNPGGLLPEAIAVAENFLQPGDPIVSTRGRTSDMYSQHFARAQPSLPPDIPLVVLINEGSASASEIVAGAVQDLDRGVILGRPSFGKGLVQSVVPFSDGTALRMTTAKYYTPSGRLIQKADYFTDNESLLTNGEEVEEDTLFHTVKGREVKAHGGISPDIDIQFDDVGDLTLTLWRQDQFFDFISGYVVQNPELDSWENTDGLFEAFLAHLDTVGFSYESELEGNLKKLEKAAQEKRFAEDFLSELEDLRQIAARMREQEFEHDRPEIEQRLRLELASALAGNAGRVQASLAFDPQVSKAVEILSNQNEYASTLSGTTTAQRKGE